MAKMNDKFWQKNINKIRSLEFKNLQEDGIKLRNVLEFTEAKNITSNSKPEMVVIHSYSDSESEEGFESEPDLDSNHEVDEKELMVVKENLYSICDFLSLSYEVALDVYNAISSNANLIHATLDDVTGDILLNLVLEHNQSH